MAPESERAKADSSAVSGPSGSTTQRQAEHGDSAAPEDRRNEMHEPIPSVVHRTGRPTFADYEEAIADLQHAQIQLEPDGQNCSVCHDSGHQAWECHHNPLIRARMAVAYENWAEKTHEDLHSIMGVGRF
jgi:hypothetical protein